MPDVHHLTTPEGSDVAIPASPDDRKRVSAGVGSLFISFTGDRADFEEFESGDSYVIETGIVVRGDGTFVVDAAGPDEKATKKGKVKDAPTKEQREIAKANESQPVPAQKPEK